MVVPPEPEGGWARDEKGFLIYYIGSAAAGPESTVKFFMPFAFLVSARKIAHVDEMPCDGRRRRHRRTDKVGAAIAPLTALEIAV